MRRAVRNFKIRKERTACSSLPMRKIRTRPLSLGHERPDLRARKPHFSQLRAISGPIFKCPSGVGCCWSLLGPWRTRNSSLFYCSVDQEELKIELQPRGGDDQEVQPVPSAATATKIASDSKEVTFKRLEWRGTPKAHSRNKISRVKTAYI